MIGIVITESNIKGTTEAKFFIGLKKASVKYFDIDICMVRESHHTRPDNFRTTVDNMLENPNISKVFIICDNENQKIDRTKDLINKFDRNKKDSIF